MFYPLNYRSLEPPPGVEPGTSFVPGMRSIQLSYGGKTANNRSGIPQDATSMSDSIQAAASMDHTASAESFSRNSGTGVSSADTSEDRGEDNNSSS